MLEGEHLLIEQAARGDGEAFGAIYDHYHPQIYRFIYLKTGRKEEAEDLTHQVFLKAWQHLPTYVDQGHPLSSWLYRMARNSVIDFYRTRRDAPAIDALDPEKFLEESEAESKMEVQLAMADIRQVMTSMKPMHQDVLILRFIEELSLKECAKALGKSEGAVKLIQHRAMKELQKRLSVQNPSLVQENGSIQSPETV